MQTIGYYSERHYKVVISTGGRNLQIEKNLYSIEERFLASLGMTEERNINLFNALAIVICEKNIVDVPRTFKVRGT